MSRAAVVVNPTKLDGDETFGRTVRRVMDDHGWGELLWLETTLEDPGRGRPRRRFPRGLTSCSPAAATGLSPAAGQVLTGWASVAGRPERK